MRIQTILSLIFVLALSSAASAGESNCDLKVAESVREILKYDIDCNGRISLKESLKSYDYFDAYIRDISRIEIVPLRKAVFTYVLNYQKLPNPVEFAAWTAMTPFWKYERNEVQIRNAMSALYNCQ